MTSKNLSVTIPDEMYERLEEKRKTGHYSRSEFVREALRAYIGFDMEKVTDEETKGIEQGRRDIERGDVVTLADVKSEHGIS